MGYKEKRMEEIIEKSLTERLEKCYSGAVYDVLARMGYKNVVLPNDILPLNKKHILVGQIFTVSGHFDEKLDDHQTLLEWTKLLSKAPSNKVLVCQPNDGLVSHMGELSAETLKYKGVRGYVVDGGCRDTDFILKLGFPVSCKYTTPKDIVGMWTVDKLGGEIVIGGVSIKAGDYIISDRDGTVIIKQDMAEDVITKTELVMRTEDLVRKAILNGVDPVEAYLKYGKF